MALHRDNQNPTDNSFHQSGVNAIVVDTLDPDKRGRVRCRILGEQENIPLEKLPWIDCMGSGAQVAGVGMWPNPGYQVGSKVVLLNQGQQGYLVMGAIGNSDKDQNKADIHPAATDTSPTLTRFGKGPNNRQPLLDGAPIDPRVQRGIEAAMKIGSLKETLPNWQKANPLEAILQKAPTLSQYGYRSSIKIPETHDLAKSIGMFKSAGMNAQQFMKGKNIAGPIKDAADIIESLKKVNGKSPSITNGLGGFSRLLSMLTGILSFIKDFAKIEGLEDAAEVLEAIQELEGMILEVTTEFNNITNIS